MIQANSRLDPGAVSWDVQIGRIMRVYKSLTPADLNFTANQKDDLIRSLIVKLGVSANDIKDVMNKTGRYLR